jgi:2-polyprenyl-3-methyl-5-hydroxy-6-metoxy-1,4-benzoquinol methylase
VPGLRGQAAFPAYNIGRAMKPPTKKKPQPLSRRARALLSRLRAPGRNPAAASIDQWNLEYQSGKWDYLGGLAELGRYGILVGYLRHFKPGGSILDVGCGAGVLYRRLQPQEYSRYVGVDCAGSAIGTLQASAAGNSAFVAADAESYLPAERFDALVFNEVLLYFREPDLALERYAGALNSGGIVLVSTCVPSRRGSAILGRLRRRYPVLDETTVSHGSDRWSWVVTVLAPGGNAA